MQVDLVNRNPSASAESSVPMGDSSIKSIPSYGVVKARIVEESRSHAEILEENHAKPHFSFLLADPEKHQ